MVEYRLEFWPEIVTTGVEFVYIYLNAIKNVSLHVNLLAAGRESNGFCMSIVVIIK